MDNHPIPQDVTGFQFKLIGDMTVKQFAYLATGIVLAVVLFQIPVNILIKFPFCAFFAILGIALAYFPVSGRPMDMMIGNYIKALIKPTVFIYDKTGSQTYPSDKTPAMTRDSGNLPSGISLFPKDKLKAYLENLDAKPKNKVDEIEDNFLTSVSNLAKDDSAYQPPVVPEINNQQPVPQPSVPVINNDPPPQTITVTTPISPIIPSPKAEAPQPPVIPMEQIAPDKPTPTPEVNKAATISAPTSPNLIIGVTKDARGNTLSNILVEIKDKDNNPVRAFKTNEVGRFASATPLMNGTYTIDFEDPKAQNKFEKIIINVVGQIIPPIEALSVDMREELRRSLFASNSSMPKGAQKN
jgi:hypothetical protein